MNEEIKQRIAKVYALVQQGTAGEQAAAKLALDKMMKKYNLDETDVRTIGLRDYTFKYSTELEINLFIRIWIVLLGKPASEKVYKDNWRGRNLVVKLAYEDWVLLDCAYEYFRRHMKGEYKKTVLPEVRKCRTDKTKAKRREELSEYFFSRYIIASGLYKPTELVDVGRMSKKEMRDRSRMRNIEGGNFKKQVVGNNLLENY